MSKGYLFNIESSRDLVLFLSLNYECFREFIVIGVFTDDVLGNG